MTSQTRSPSAEPTADHRRFRSTSDPLTFATRIAACAHGVLAIAASGIAVHGLVEIYGFSLDDDFGRDMLTLLLAYAVAVLICSTVTVAVRRPLVVSISAFVAGLVPTVVISDDSSGTPQTLWVLIYYLLAVLLTVLGTAGLVAAAVRWWRREG